MAALLSTCSGMGFDCVAPSSLNRERRYTASLVASEAATISASQLDRETDACFLEAHEIAARLYMKTYPVVECRVAQSESEKPTRRLECAGVEESPDETLVPSGECLVLGVEATPGNGMFNQGGEFGLCRRVIHLETRRNAPGCVCSEELLDVRRLTEHNVTALDCDVDVEEVGHFPFVFDAPAVDERCGELVVEAVGRVARVKDKKVVHVTSDDELVVTTGFAEDARVRGGLFEPLRFKPGEERALPSASGLSHPVDRLLYATDSRATVGPDGGVARWWVAIYDFPGF
eukprot:140860-Pleurochrysis_carterae.AAC.4